MATKFGKTLKVATFLLLGVAFTVVVACHSKTLKNKNLSREPAAATPKELSGYKLEQFAQVANYLLVQSDLQLKNEMIRDKCSYNINPPNFLTMNNAIHALIDEKMEDMRRIDTRLSSTVFESKLRKNEIDCKKNCTCGVWQSYYEGVEFTPAGQRSFESIKENAKQLDASARKACAQKLRWFCGSPLENYLKNQN